MASQDVVRFPCGSQLRIILVTFRVRNEARIGSCQRPCRLLMDSAGCASSQHADAWFLHAYSIMCMCMLRFVLFCDPFRISFLDNNDDPSKLVAGAVWLL